MAGGAIVDRDFVPGLLFEIKLLLSQSSVKSGDARAALKFGDEALAAATRMNNARTIALAQLARANALLEGGEPKKGLDLALEVQRSFATGGQYVSEWQAWRTAALASRRLRDEAKAAEYGLAAKAALSRLEQQWNTENYKNYLSRPDVQHGLRQLDEVQASKN
ncbi:MAG: hypothetical protein ABI882_18235 [Acidobacteriota bacterium]